MNAEPKTKSIGPRRRLCRNGKIARLPQNVREELNQRLQDGESGRGLVKWLNELAEVKSALKREFGGCLINEQNLSEWKRGGYRDWVAKVETDELMADTLGHGLGPEVKRNGRASTSRRKESREKALETVSDKVAGWFFPHYVAAARGQLAAARTPAERWLWCCGPSADLAGLRRSDHYVERLRIWREKLQLETETTQREITKKEFVKLARPPRS